MSLLEAAVGWLAPPQCVGCSLEGSALCQACATSEILPFGERCWRCNSLSPHCRTCPKCRLPGSPSFVWINTDHEGLVRQLISLYKFGHQRVAAEPIAELMVDNFRDFNSSQDILSKNYLVVPIPTATSRIRERGFGHSELLARKIALKLRLEQTNALRRLGQIRQLGSKREDRLRQLASSFAVKNPKLVASRRILLVDDVVTTGGTLMAATKVLRAAGATQVDALLLAKRL
ncbi:MAG: ComF family protein [Candidatus Saccharimonadales bacterium]